LADLDRGGALLAWLGRRRRNFAFLRRVGEIVGREYESMPYEALTKSAEELSTERVVDGVRLFFSAEAYQTKANGDLCFSIDVDARDLPTLLGVRPSYHFYKRPDGTVYY
jgi:hypothetical protein